MPRVLIVDDHPVVRVAIRMTLEHHAYEIVGETDNGVDALRIVRETPVDVIILDIGMPKLDGMELISRLKKIPSPPYVLVLTSNNALASRCLQLGASGFISKEEDFTGIIRALETICAGYTHFPMDALSTVIRGETKNDDEELLHSLTDREIIVLKQLASGLSNKRIADTMLLSNKTISTYKTRILQKLKAQTVFDLVDFAKRNRLI